MKLSTTKIVLLSLFIGLLVIVSYARRDMQLNVDLLRDSLLNMPALIMENIQLARTVSGDIWRVKVPYLDREGDTVRMRSLDIRRQISGDKGEWYFFGKNGLYSNDKKTAVISGLLGTLETDTRTLNLESNRLNWQEGVDSLVFPEGLTIFDDELMLKTPLASIDKSGVILLEQGGVIQWVKPLER